MKRYDGTPWWCQLLWPWFGPPWYAQIKDPDASGASVIRGAHISHSSAQPPQRGRV